MISWSRLLVPIVFLFSFLPVSAEMMSTTEFGPKKYHRTRQFVKDHFDVVSPETKTFKLIVKNGNGRELSLRNCRRLSKWKRRWCKFRNYITIRRAKFFRAKKVVVKINNKKVFGRKDLNLLTGTVEKQISLESSNEIAVKVKGGWFARASVRIESSFENQAPIARFSFATDSNDPQKILFDASNSTDDGQIISYNWDFGDGQVGDGPMVSHEYSSPGVYSVTLTVVDDGGLSQSVSQQVQVEAEVNLPPTALFTSTAASGQVPFMLLLDASGSSDPEGLPLTYSWNLGDGTTAQGEMVTHTYQDPGTFIITLTVSDSVGQTATFSASIEALGVVLPPDPSEVAPPIAQNQLTDPGSLTEFIYSGSNPIQRDVASGVINKDIASWIRGRVIDRDGNPISGARVTFLNHPELGHTLTRADGRYDMVVNGGEIFVVDIELAGYLPVQRQFNVGSLGSKTVEDVILIALDEKILPFTSNQTTSQVLVGSQVNDDSGARQSILYVPPSTQAEVILPNGNRQPFSNLNLRFTEYTVGPEGYKMMPGTLPSSTAYTYAFEASADEALALNAKTIEFSKPVSYYIDNFLDAPQGAIVPVGIYNREKGLWEAERNGVVVHYVSDDSNGLPVLGLTVSGNTTQADLDYWRIDNEELQKIAEVYDPGQSFWRVQLDHFSPIDCNYPTGSGGGFSDQFPGVDPPPNLDDGPTPPPICNASFVEPNRQTFGENLPIFGTPFQVVYKSDRVAGYKPNRKFELTLPNSMGQNYITEVKIDVLGREIRRVFEQPTGQTESFEWDGLDSAGRKPIGLQKAQVTISNQFVSPLFPVSPDIGYAFEGYVTGFSGTEGFGRPASENVGNFGVLRVGNNLSRINSFTKWLGHLDWRFEGLGGWSINVHHRYDPLSQILYRGDGSLVRGDSYIIQEVGGTCSVAGNSCFSNSGNGSGVPVKDVVLGNPQDMVFDGLGNLYIAEREDGTIRRVDTAGIITTVAGGGSDASGENVPSSQVQIQRLKSVALDVNGDIIYAEDERIRRIDSNGLVSTIAGALGVSTPGGSGDNGPAVSATFQEINDIVISPDGSLYVADANVVRKIMTNGTIVLYVGDPNSSVSDLRDGQPATSGYVGDITSLAVDSGGYLYYVSRRLPILSRVEADGTVRFLSGLPTGFQQEGDGGPANNALLGVPSELALADDGSIYIFSDNNNTQTNREEGFNIRKISPTGIIDAFVSQKGLDDLATSGSEKSISGIPALEHSIAYVKGLAVSPNGELYILQGQSPSGSNFTPLVKATSTFGLIKKPTSYEIVSQDGQEIYIFNLEGQHVETKRALTRATKYLFDYTNDRLTSITDGDGNRTEIMRGADNIVQKIVSPFGQETQFAMNSEGYLENLVTPNSESYSFAYNSEGLMSSVQKPDGASSTLTYDSDGLLVLDQDVEGGKIIIEKLLAEDGFNTIQKISSAEGRMTIHKTDYGTNSILQSRTTVNPDGSEDIIESNYRSTKTRKGDNSFSKTVRFQVDPQFPQRKIIQNQAESDESLRKLRFEKEFNLLNPNDPNSDFVINESTFFGTNEYETTRVYTSANKQWVTTSPEGRQTAMTIDDQERIRQLSVSGLTPIDYIYDSQGRLSQVTQGTRVTQYAYNQQGFLDSITNANSETTRFEYDSNGRVTKQILADSREIAFEYDGRGNLTGLTPPGRPQHQMQYNGQDLLAAYLPPQVGSQNRTTTYTYNRDKQLTNLQRPDGRSIAFNYGQSSGRLQSQVSSEGTTSFSYQPNGLLASSVSEDGVTTGYQYNQELVTSLNWSGPISGSDFFQYNADGQQIRRGSGSFFLSYSPDGLFNSSDNTQFLYNSSNNLITKAYFGSTSFGTDYQYNSFGELTRATFNYNGALHDVEYTRDNLGRIGSKFETIRNNPQVTTTYNYDSTGRLSNFIKGGQTTTYTYDANNNITQISGPSGVVNATYDIQDRLISFGNNSYAYNNNGDLSSKTDTSNNQTTSYEYDVYGGLKKVVLPTAVEIEYIVDGQNRRVGRKVNGVLNQTYIYKDDLNISYIRESDGSFTYFGYGEKSHVPDSFRKDGATREDFRIITDHLGSVRLVVNLSGQIVQEMDYDPYGKVVKDTNPGFQPFGFAGGLYDHQTGLVRFGARDYDAETGRWTSKDPIGFAGLVTNLYSYAMNDPVNLRDATGRIVIDDTGGNIPPQVRDSNLFRQIDQDPLNLVRITIDNRLPSNVAGETEFDPGTGSQIVRINPSAGANPTVNDLLDTYIHELNHARQNILYGGTTTEFFDTQLILPIEINQNFGPGGIERGQCR